jgi:hypothetical protein
MAFRHCALLCHRWQAVGERAGTNRHDVTTGRLIADAFYPVGLDLRADHIIADRCTPDHGCSDPQSLAP